MVRKNKTAKENIGAGSLILPESYIVTIGQAFAELCIFHLLIERVSPCLSLWLNRLAQPAGSPGWMEGFTDILIQKDTICKPERGWQTVYSCWQKVRYWQYWYSLAHFFLLASLPTSHQFLILLSGNVYIPAVKSHCWIWFQTTLCWEHIEIKTHGECSYFKAFLSSYGLKTAADQKHLSCKQSE